MNWRSRIVFLITVCLVTTHFSLAYISETGPFLVLRAFAAGRERQPFQERALTSWLLRGVFRFDSPALELRLHHLLPSLGDAFNLAILTIFALAWLSMAASILVTRLSLYRLTNDAVFSYWTAFLVPYMAYFVYILNFGPHFLLPYDLLSLFFFCAGMYLILARRPLALILLVAVATLNRETAIFIAIFYVLFEWPSDAARHRRLPILANAAMMAVAWLMVRAVLLHLYGANPMDSHSRFGDLHLWQNLGFFVKPQQWPSLASLFGFTLPLVIVRRNAIYPMGLRRGLLGVALWFALMLCVGVIIETRIYGELISYMSIALGTILYPVVRRQYAEEQAENMSPASGRVSSMDEGATAAS